MSVTVRLIFWGLMGFVPNPEGHDGMTALLVDPQKMQTEGSECGVPSHIGAVYMLDGKCVEGDCRRSISEDDLAAANQMGFNEPTIGAKLPLAWLLNQEDLTIFGDREDSKLKVRKPWLSFFANKICPTSKRQAGYYSWVQSISSLTGGHGQLNEHCLKADTDCPIRARFTVPGGKVGACHLLHGFDARDATTDERNVEIFEYTAPNQKSFSRAVADASLVEYEVKGDSVLLLSQHLPGGGTPFSWARLTPDAQGKLTLVVANFPPHNSGNPPTCPPHSNLLFSLLADQNGPRFSRTKTAETKRVFPGVCEREANLLVKMIEGNAAHEHPHTGTACDGLTYP